MNPSWEGSECNALQLRIYCLQEVQAGVSTAFASQSTAQAPPPANPNPPQEPPAAPQASTSSSSSAPSSSSGAGLPGGGPTSKSPRLLWSEDAELAEARERCQWHEVMSRRNGGEHTEKLQVLHQDARGSTEEKHSSPHTNCLATCNEMSIIQARKH